MARMGSSIHEQGKGEQVPAPLEYASRSDFHSKMPVLRTFRCLPGKACRGDLLAAALMRRQYCLPPPVCFHHTRFRGARLLRLRGLHPRSGREERGRLLWVSPAQRPRRAGWFRELRTGPAAESLLGPRSCRFPAKRLLSPILQFRKIIAKMITTQISLMRS